VLNREGRDITKKFTKLLKELFLFILFKSAGNSNGISSERLIELLWFDKDPKSGRNNLSVNVAKLKDILKEIDGCTLDHETGYWKLIYDRKKLFIEYIEITKVVEKKGSSLSVASLTTLLRAANRGQFLVNLDYEWLDRYKGQVSDMIVDTLISYAESLDPQSASSLIIQIANSVFNFDSVNEEAMMLKCRTQSILGKHSLSMKTYEDFCKEYETLYGERFKRPFRSIINE
jgi:two-component SAPR family response regulator